MEILSNPPSCFSNRRRFSYSMVFREVPSHDASLGRHGSSAPMWPDFYTLPLEPSKTPTIPPLGSLVSYWEGVLREKGVFLSSRSSSDSDSIFISGAINMDRNFNPENPYRYPQPLGAEQYPWVDREVMGYRSTTRHLGGLVVVEKTEEEMEKYEIILPSDDERFCMDHSITDGGRSFYMYHALHSFSFFFFPDGHPKFPSGGPFTTSF